MITMEHREDIKTVEKIVEEFMPIIEKVSGFKFNGVFIKAENGSAFSSSFGYDPNTIIINRNSIAYNGFFNSRKRLEEAVMHELAHHVHYNINPQDFKCDCRKCLMICEGFAEYFCLDLLPEGILSEEIVNEYMNWLRKSFSTYGIGYRFFRKVTNSLGKEEAITIIKTSDMTFEEINAPELYIERRRNEIR